MNIRMPLVTLVLVGLVGTIPAHAQESKTTVADEVIAVAKADWAASNAKNVAEAMKNVADDYTEFNPVAATRIEGKAMAQRLGEAQAKDDAVALDSEMLNPKVQVYGDVAILSYNYLGATKKKDGTVEQQRAKSTRVYAKQSGKWMLVHANFGADPVRN